MQVEALLSTFFSILTQIKLYHWSTMQYGVHKALDDLHGSLSDKVDQFVESYIGRFKKQPLPAMTLKMEAVNDISKLEKYLEQARDSLKTIAKAVSKESQLLNILDEMVADIDKTVYLIHLK